ncbi:phenylalanyl-tRNA synthetase, beta subunit [Xylanimonas cellulosilytica DSM 15894]|uniref:Phenylalanine--tRNA ligase beta subunit n=1 Tax=Xylanimonas cellulosilytica (strain DSM 15894 / JCM 12276 / CECT 5975 / KCTC 9989 / LMG 20990 / NBRC 107835 / XIL07) TaxID=446471 RepID=D1BR98_XYLCX|nr:phenylalanine--tRNA ligase subunit beta [Xylanimonas cellulosilytica]ACZ30353.1 phenylalanyl-tRNA synthetase, beta subunit [Xylanimonas cellulosilytica DSM 15894]
MPLVVTEWLADHVELPTDLTAEQLAAALVKVGLEEEAVHAAKVTGPLVVGRVLAQTPEPQKNGKTINWCLVDVGPEHNATQIKGVDPADIPAGGARGIICGAHNFGVGDLVVVALPGTVLPGPFPIAARKTYGHVSDGMICSTAELGLGDGGHGIIVVPRDLGIEDAVPGQDAIALLGLGDEVLEINVTPDRGYAFSYRGVAREFSHSTGAAFTDRALVSDLPAATADGFAVEVDDAAPIHGVVGCDRFVTRIVRDLDPTAPTPSWMKRRLEASGMRSISLAVDVTNYVMLDLGQPLHAYDLDKVAAPVVVRRATPGERLTTLDDVDRALDSEDLLITDSPDGRASRVLGLAGVMGGASSEVSEATTAVLVEAAHFDPITVARTARRHRLPSEAAKRFERGVDPRLPAVAAQRVVDLLVEHGGGTADPAVGDLDATTAPAPITFPVGLATRVAGVEYPREQVVGILEQIGCTVAPGPTADEVVVTPPTWRPDLTERVALVEEIVRIAGYDQIPSVVPAAPGGRGLTAGQRVRRSVARALAEAGLVETLSYPFIGDAELDALGLPADDARRTAVRLANPLADDRPLMRTSLLATLVETARRNVARGLPDVAVFEVGLVTLPTAASPAAPQLPVGVRPSADELEALAAAVPAQPRHVAAVLTGRSDLAGWWGTGRTADWADALELARLVAERAGVAVAVEPATDVMPWHPGRCAALVVDGGDADERIIGYAGELHPKVVERTGLPKRSVAFELDLTALEDAASGEPVAATPVSAFPAAKEDFAFVVDDAVPAETVRAAVVTGAGDLLEDVSLFDVFTGEQLGEGRKSLAYSVRLRAADRTLTADEVRAAREAIVAAATEAGATLRA